MSALSGFKSSSEKKFVRNNQGNSQDRISIALRERPEKTITKYECDSCEEKL